MKKLFTIIIVAGLTLTIQAQDITNTLGSSTGEFKINGDGGTTLVKVKEGFGQPEVIIGTSSASLPSGTTRQLNIVKEGGTAGMNLFSY